MLPTKWQIKITSENKDILREYWLTLDPSEYYKENPERFRGYLINEEYDGSWLTYNKIGGKGGHTNISLDTFKQYVLNSFDPEDWDIEVETEEQFNEVCDFLLKKDYKRRHFWKNEGNGFSGGARFIGTSDDEEGFTYSSGHYHFSLSKRITWEQFQTLKNKNMKYTIQDLNKYSYQSENNIVVHITTSGQHARLQKVCPKMANFNFSKSYYLTSAHGYAETPYYKTIEFSDIDLGEKIIGYKAPFVIYASESTHRIEKDEVLKLTSSGAYYKRDGESLASYYLAKEIVETWEPVYEEVIKSETISLGTPARVFTVFKDLIEMKDGDGEIRSYSSADLESLLSKFRSSVWNGVNIDVTSMQLGCAMGTELSKADLLKIQEIQTKL
jgi:hypothetical protein